jgi:hypothetical protein
MRGGVLGLAAGGVVLLAAPAHADGGLEVNPSTAARGQTVGIYTGDNCTMSDGSARVASGAFGSVTTDVKDGEASVSVRVKKNASYQTYPITLTCTPSNRKITGSVTVKPAEHRRCYQDADGHWQGKCHHRGPETGGGGTMAMISSAPAAATGVGLIGASAVIGGIAWLRRSRRAGSRV